MELFLKIIYAAFLIWVFSLFLALLESLFDNRYDICNSIALEIWQYWPDIHCSISVINLQFSEGEDSGKKPSIFISNTNINILCFRIMFQLPSKILKLPALSLWWFSAFSLSCYYSKIVKNPSNMSLHCTNIVKYNWYEICMFVLTNWIQIIFSL